MGFRHGPAQVTLYTEVAQLLTPEHRQTIDHLLQVAEGEHRSSLFHFKQYPASPGTRPSGAPRIAMSSLALELNTIDWSGIRPEHIQQLAQLARHYHVWSLRRFKEKKYALVACFLLETQKHAFSSGCGHA